MEIPVEFGKLPPKESYGKKDAVHQPWMCVTSYETVMPGERLHLVSNLTVKKADLSDEIHGIVDPWLNEKVPSGTPFIMLIRKDLVEKFSHQFQIKGATHIEVVDEYKETDIEDTYSDDGCSPGCG